MEEQSIFQTELSTTSNGHILSAAKWSRFLGIVFLICAGFALLGVLGMSFAMGSYSEIFSTMAATSPQLAMLENVPQALFITLMLVAVGLFVFIGVMFINIGKHGIAYFSSNEEMAFINTFKWAKNYFLVYSIITILTILISVIGLF